ncbi:helix-turn-helix domain-containing protein [Kitasatospora aureofaciens]|uniref:helix-turn-helix domain-containing protein n=1 Tax=Kitasatospora aureofaciens TaxID=1894 RepID=UPI000526FD67|nr:pyridoxamine 5'-phosphate oxidase family protein [Kitasatospora aureofaciens]
MIPDRTDPAAIARRILQRRDQLGLSEGMLAYRTHMSPAYLRQLLCAGPEFDREAFLRIATALGTTWSELLTGRRPDAPPGQADPAAPRPLLLHLTGPQCWELLGTHGVGRIGLPGRAAPVVLPVNYTVDARTVVYRTAAQGAAAPTEGSPASFQVDHVDDHRSNGWSVLILGEAHHIDDPDEQRRLSARPGATPWAGGARPLWVRISPSEIAGRRLGTE